LVRNLRSGLIADIVADHEAQIEIDCKVGVLKALHYSQADIMKATGASAKEIRESVERLQRCSKRMAA
jgi:hypothetical protein